MKLLEPTTTITDYILAAETLALGIWLLRGEGAASSLFSTRLWAFAFLATGLAAAMGGTYHGFQDSLQPSTASALWKVTVFSVGFTSLFMLSGTAVALLKPPVRNLMLAAALLQFVIYALWMIQHNEFKYVIYNYAPAMVLILALHVFALYRGTAGAGWIVAGILLSFAGAGIQQSGFSLHRHFNHNDLYHVIQMASMYLLFRGAQLLRNISETKLV